MKTLSEIRDEHVQTVDACCGTSDIYIAAEKAFDAGAKAVMVEANLLAKLGKEVIDNFAEEKQKTEELGLRIVQLDQQKLMGLYDAIARWQEFTEERDGDEKT